MISEITCPKEPISNFFADDCLLFREIDSLSDAERHENHLQSLVKWSNTWQMSFNVSKCHTLKVSKKKNPIQFQYPMNNVQVPEVDRHPYLGVELERNTSRSQHITDTANKASSTLGFYVETSLHALLKSRLQHTKY